MTAVSRLEQISFGWIVALGIMLFRLSLFVETFTGPMVFDVLLRSSEVRVRLLPSE